MKLHSHKQCSNNLIIKKINNDTWLQILFLVLAVAWICFPTKVFAKQPQLVEAGSVGNEVSIVLVNDGEETISGIRLYAQSQPDFVHNIEHRSMQEEEQEIKPGESARFRFTFDVDRFAFKDDTAPIVFKIAGPPHWQSLLSEHFNQSPRVMIKVEKKERIKPPSLRLVKAGTEERGLYGGDYSAEYNRGGVGGTQIYEKITAVGSEKYLFSIGFTEVPSKIELGKPFRFRGKFAISSSFSKNPGPEVTIEDFFEEHPCYNSKTLRCLTRGAESSFIGIFRDTQRITANPSGVRDFTIQYDPVQCMLRQTDGYTFPCRSEQGQSSLHSGDYSQLEYTYRATSGLKGFEPQVIGLNASNDLVLSTDKNGFLDNNGIVTDEEFTELKNNLNKYNQGFFLEMLGLEVYLSYRPILKGEDYLTSVKGYKFPASLNDNVADIAVSISDDIANGISDGQDSGKDHNKVSLPNVIGMSYTDAVTKIKDAGLVPLPPELGKDAVRPNDVGKVELALPTVDGQLYRGDEIRMILFGEAVAAAKVPNVIGLGVKAAADAVEAAGFTPAFELGEDTEDIRKDQTIARQAPSAGLEIELGREIKLIIYTMTVKSIATPDLNGMPIAKAHKVIQGLGLTMAAELGMDATRSSDVGLVYRQEPEADLEIMADAEVTVWIYGEQAEREIASRQQVSARVNPDEYPLPGGVPYIDIPEIPGYQGIDTGVWRDGTFHEWDIPVGRYERPNDQFLIVHGESKTTRAFTFDCRMSSGQIRVNAIWLEPSDTYDSWARFCIDHTGRGAFFEPGGYEVSPGTNYIQKPRVIMISNIAKVKIDISGTEKLIRQHKELLLQIAEQVMLNIEPYAKSCQSYQSQPQLVKKPDTSGSSNGNTGSTIDSSSPPMPSFKPECRCRDKDGRPYWVSLGMDCGADDLWRHYDCD